jgi:hypothetical protein
MVAKEKTKITTKKKTSAKKSGENIGICFTIMPFGGWFDDYYESIFCPAIEAARLTPKRADDLYRPSTIVHDIWEYTQQAKLILADLSGKNPNVFYELGLAHALAKPAILVTESMDDVPFDLRALRVIEYDKNDPNWGGLLADKIEKSIGEVLESPTQSVLPAFLSIKKSSTPTTISEKDKDIIELKQEMSRLSREVRSRYSKHQMEKISGPSEAESLIHSYLNMGLERIQIVRRLIDRGAPSHWVETTIDEIIENKDKKGRSGKRIVKKNMAKKKSAKKK